MCVHFLYPCFTVCHMLSPNLYRGADKSLAQPGRKQARNGSMSGTRAISTTSRRELSSPRPLQGKVPKEIYAILTETLACTAPNEGIISEY